MVDARVNCVCTGPYVCLSMYSVRELKVVTNKYNCVCVKLSDTSVNNV